MTSFQGGIFSAYESIAPYRLYLNTTNQDIEFMSGIRDPLSLTEANTNLFGTVKPFIGTTSYAPLKLTFENSVYNRIKSNPKLQNFSKLIDNFKLHDLLESYRTYFIPTDDDVLSWNELYSKIRNGTLSPRDIVSYHILDYVLTPVQMFSSVFRVDTLLKNEKFIIDGSKHPKIMLENNAFTDKDNFVLKTEKTQDGWIYVIQRPIYPYLI